MKLYTLTEKKPETGQVVLIFSKAGTQAKEAVLCIHDGKTQLSEATGLDLQEGNFYWRSYQYYGENPDSASANKCWMLPAMYPFWASKDELVESIFPQIKEKNEKLNRFEMMDIENE